MSAITDLRDELKIDAAVDDNESIADSVIERWISESIVEHNSGYSTDGSNLPSRERPLVKLLAWIKLTFLRASQWATKNSLSGGQGYGNDRDTPFNKLSQQAKMLREDYELKCRAMGISNDADGTGSLIVQSQLTVLDIDGYRTPALFDQTGLPVPALTSVSAGGEVVLSWTKTKDDTFTDYLILYKAGANQTLFDASNIESTTGVPRIVDAATLVSTITNPDWTSLRVTGLTLTNSYTFILAVRNRQGKYAYSAAITVIVA